MTRDHPFDGDVTTEEEFDAALEQLLSAARENGVDPQGSWVYRNGRNAPDWEVMVVELAKDDGID